MKRNKRRVPLLTGKTASFRGLFVAALMLSTCAGHAACEFRAPFVNDVPMGAISPAQTGNVVNTLSLQYRCTQGSQPVFSLRGSNDAGPGLHRMRNLSNPSAYLDYRATTTFQGRRLVVTLTVSEADYRDAWVGAYEDTLTLTIAP